MLLLEWFGYLASVVVLISLLSSSIIKLRWINLVGSIMFSVYGALIGSLPVALLNGGIVVINIYYLIKLYRTQEFFHLLELMPDSNYFSYFIEFYKSDLLDKQFEISFNDTSNFVGYYILRNTVTAGIFLASIRSDNSLYVELDYAVSEFRDFKTGRFIYENHKEFFTNHGYQYIYASPKSKSQIKYYKKMGFKNAKSPNEYVLSLNVQ